VRTSLDLWSNVGLVLREMRERAFKLKRIVEFGSVELRFLDLIGLKCGGRCYFPC
jgi:hypothetical protein